MANDAPSTPAAADEPSRLILQGKIEIRIVLDPVSGKTSCEVINGTLVCCQIIDVLLQLCNSYNRQELQAMQTLTIENTELKRMAGIKRIV